MRPRLSEDNSSLNSETGISFKGVKFIEQLVMASHIDKSLDFITPLILSIKGLSRF